MLKKRFSLKNLLIPILFAITLLPAYAGELRQSGTLSLLIAGENPDTGIIKEKTDEEKIRWLSNHVLIGRPSVATGDDRNSRVFTFSVKSGFKNIEIDNITAHASYLSGEKSLNGQITGINISNTILRPSETIKISVIVTFPGNWSLKGKKSSGNLRLSVNGIMKAMHGGKTILSAPPDESGYLRSIPLATLVRDEKISLRLQPEKLLYFFWILGFLLVVGFPAAFTYQALSPITVTLKSGKASKSFDLSHKGRIGIGENTDFGIPGCGGKIAEIQRRFRRFILVEFKEGVIPKSRKAIDGKTPLKLGEEFMLETACNAYTIQFLPGNRECEQTEDDGENILSEDFEEI